MNRPTLMLITALMIPAMIPGCIHTQSDVAVKPIDINLNINGRLELVVTDARRDLEAITGEKPQRNVTASDIGLPATPQDANPTSQPAGSMLPSPQGPAVVMLASVTPLDAAADRQEQLKQSMKARHPQVRALMDTHLVGESHTGLMAPRGAITAAQQALLDAENKDRTELYGLEAAKKGISVSEVALSFYLKRLDFARKGDWVEKFNKSTNAWEWFQWNQ